MSRERSIGALPEGVSDDMARWMRQVVQRIEQVRSIGGIGVAGVGGGGAVPVPVPGPPGPPGDPGGTYTPDLTPPPTPSGVLVSSGISFVGIETDNPTFTQGHGYLRTLVYGAKWPSGTAPTFVDAELVHEFVGSFGAFPTDPNTRWCIWLKWVSVDGVESTSPSGGTNGHQTTTGADVSGLLAVLAGQITSSHLHSTLGTRVDLIDAPDSTAGSVAQRIKAETDNRIAAVAGEAALRISGDSSTLGSAQAYTQSYTYARAAIDGSLSALDTTLRAAFASADATTLASSQAYTNSYTYARATTDAISGTLNTLSARVDNGNAAAFSPQLSWQFNGTLDGWSGYPGYFGSLTSSSTALLAVATGTPDLIININLSAAQQFLGSRADKVRMRLRRTTGSGWYGALYYGTPGHSDSGSFYKRINEPVWGADGWAIAEWDMAALDAGGSDWSLNTIQRLRFDMVRVGSPGTAGASFEIDWIAVGTRAFGVSEAALQQEASVRATETGQLFGQNTVKIDLNGYITGYGLASTGGTAAPSSSFIIRAGDFSVASPTGPGITPVVPFAVQTVPTTINGVSVPVGVYMNGAYIMNGTVVNAKIGNLAVDDAKISSLSVAKLLAGALQVGAYVRSTSYVSGSSGFTIEANGFAEFNNIVARGTIYASAGTFAGALSAATGTFAGALSAATGTFAGNLSAAGGTFAGALSAATGTFAGSLSAATGTFAGSLTAATGSFFSSTSGQRITINESSSNEARFYGNRGDGTITQMASIGINTVGSDSVVIAVGDTAGGNARVGVLARSNTARAIQGHSVSGQGLYGVSTSAEGVWGQSTSNSGVVGISSSAGASTAGVVGTNSSAGPGVHGISTSGHGGQFYGNATRAALRLEPQPFPSVGAAGSICIAGGDLYFHNGSGWRVVQSFAI